MSRLIGVMGTLVVLLAWGGCGYRTDEARQFDPKDQVGPSMGATPPKATGPTAGMYLDEQSYAISPLNCALPSMAETGCPRGHQGDQWDENGWIVELMNRARKLLSGPSMPWGCYIPHDNLMFAAQNHSAYQANHWDPPCNSDGHTESTLPQCSLNFTGVSPHARIQTYGYPANTSLATFEANEIGEMKETWPGPSNSGEAICALWDHAPYHRQVFMYSENRVIGAGKYTNFLPIKNSNGLYVDFAMANWAVPMPAYWPRPGTAFQLRSMDASAEAPTPPNCAAGWPNCGSSVHIRVPNATFTGSALCKVSGSTCTHVPHITRLPSNDPMVAGDQAFLYAHSKLDANTVYRVQFFGTVNGVSTSPWWEFATGNL